MRLDTDSLTLCTLCTLPPFFLQLLSHTANVNVPEVDMDVWGIEGCYTTVEGLMTKMKDRILSANPFQQVRHTGEGEPRETRETRETRKKGEEKTAIARGGGEK